MNIGEQIRKQRHRKQMTQKKLAEMVGKEASFVSHIERNARNVSVRMLHMIAQVLEISPIEMLAAGSNDFERCVEKVAQLDQEGLKKTSEYLEFLIQMQHRKAADKIPI